MLLVRSMTENYGRMTEFINPFNQALAFYGVSDPWNIETASGSCGLQMRFRASRR